MKNKVLSIIVAIAFRGAAQALRNTIFTLAFMTTTHKKPNGAYIGRSKAQPIRSTTIPFTRAVGKDMSITNRRPISHRDRRIAIRFTQAKSTQAVVRRTVTIQRSRA